MIGYFISLSLLLGFTYYLSQSSKGQNVIKSPSCLLSILAWFGSFSILVFFIYIFIKIKWWHPFVIFVIGFIVGKIFDYSDIRTKRQDVIAVIGLLISLLMSIYFVFFYV